MVLKELNRTPTVFAGNISAPQMLYQSDIVTVCVTHIPHKRLFSTDRRVTGGIIYGTSCSQLSNNTSVLSHSLSQPSQPKWSMIRLCENCNYRGLWIPGQRKDSLKSLLAVDSSKILPWTKEIPHLPMLPLHLLPVSTLTVLVTMGSLLFFKICTKGHAYWL